MIYSDQVVSDQYIRLRGIFEMKVMKNGVVIERYRDDNLIVDAARSSLARLLSGEGAATKKVTQIGFGTSGTAPATTDTSLTSSFIKNIDSYSYPAAGQASFAWSLSTTEANGKSIQEVGLISADGTLFARKTRGVIEKASDISLSGSWTIIF